MNLLRFHWKIACQFNNFHDDGVDGEREYDDDDDDEKKRNENELILLRNAIETHRCMELIKTLLPTMVLSQGKKNTVIPD